MWLLCLFCFFAVSATSWAKVASSFFELSAEDIHGNIISMSEYADNSSVILVVNVASNCGFTYTQYKDLKMLHKKYYDRGLQILAFPSNSFEMEPGSNHDVDVFTRNYGITFPVFSKIEVNGRGSVHPIYRFLKEEYTEDDAMIGWNFVKYLVVEGRPVNRFASRVKPREMEAEIVEYLDMYDMVEEPEL